MSRFQVGQSGNPAGRPRGIVDRRSQIRLVLEGSGTLLIEEAIHRAMNGSDQLLVTLLNRLIPPIRPENVLLNVEEASEISVRWLGSDTS